MFLNSLFLKKKKQWTKSQHFFEKLHNIEANRSYVILCLNYLLVPKRFVHIEIILDERKYFHLCLKMVFFQAKYHFGPCTTKYTVCVQNTSSAKYIEWVQNLSNMFKNI